MNSGIKVEKRDCGGTPSGLLCRHRPSAEPGGRRTVIDDSGSLAITVWACADCGELIEEVQRLSRHGKSRGAPCPVCACTASANERSSDSFHGTLTARRHRKMSGTAQESE